MIGLLQHNQFFPRRPLNDLVRKERQMKFIFTADIKFDAVDFNDALAQLQKHFKATQDTSLDSPLEFIGKLELKKEEG